MSVLHETSPYRPASSARINEHFVQTLLASLGGVPVARVPAESPDGLLTSYRIGDYLVDFKSLHHDPQNILEIYERAEAFAADRYNPRSIAATVNEPGPELRAYWRRFLSKSISRELDRSAAHVHYCRAYLYQPQLKGMVFFVNQSIPLLEPSHFETTLAGAQARHVGAIALCTYYCRLPGPHLGRILQGMVPNGSEHDAFGDTFLSEFERHLLT